MKYLITVCLMLVATYSQACIHLKLGVPKESDFVDCRLGYAIGYNYALKSAEWVSYILERQEGEGVERTNDFRLDPEIPQEYRTTPQDYNEPVYDQGHLANSESLDGSIEMMSETFFMSNMVPQLPKHNRAIWKGLENRERKVANNRGYVVVISGPLYEGDITYIGNRVPVPSHLWKVIYDHETLSSVAYIIDHKPLKTNELRNYLSSIDEIEERAGVDLLSALDKSTQAKIEAVTSKKPWNK